MQINYCWNQTLSLPLLLNAILVICPTNPFPLCSCATKISLCKFYSALQIFYFFDVQASRRFSIDESACVPRLFEGFPNHLFPRSCTMEIHKCYFGMCIFSSLNAWDVFATSCVHFIVINGNSKYSLQEDRAIRILF